MATKLIKTLSEVTAQVPVNMTSDLDVVSPFLAHAESAYVARLIGDAQFAALVAYNNATDDRVDEKTEAVTRCQKVIANLGYYFAVPVLAVSIGSTGIQVFSNTDTKQAFQWQVGDLKNALQELGFTGIEEMLTYLEAYPDIFTQYRDSDQLAALKANLITTAADFNDYFEINSSRFVFQSICYIMKRVEQLSIGKLIGTTLLDALKAADASEKKKELADRYLKPGIALLTVAKAIVERVVTLKDGLVTYNFKGRTDNMNESQAVSNQQIESMAEQLVADGNTFIQDGLQFIYNNPEEFPDFTPPVARRRFRVKNDPCNGIFAT